MLDLVTAPSKAICKAGLCVKRARHCSLVIDIHKFAAKRETTENAALEER